MPSRTNLSSMFTPALPIPMALIVNWDLAGDLATASESICAGSFINSLLASEYLSECGADAISQGIPGGAFALMEGAKFDQTNGGGEFRLIEGGFQAAHGVGLADA